MSTFLDAVNSWLAEVSRHHNTKLNLNDAGVYSMLHDGDLDIRVEVSHPGDELFMHAVLFEAPADSIERLQLFDKMLRASYLGRGTYHHAIGLDDDDKSVQIWKRYDAELLDLGTFKDALDDLIAAARSIRNDLDK